MDFKNMRPEDMAELVTKGIGSSFEELIYQELRAQAEVTARKVAKEIADRLAAQVKSAYLDPTMSFRMDFDFNMISMDSNPVGEVIGANGVPLVSWACDTQKLIGKKLFAAK